MHFTEQFNGYRTGETTKSNKKERDRIIHWTVMEEERREAVDCGGEA